MSKGKQRTVVVGSRQSALALTQTQQVIADLRKLAELNGIEANFEIRKIVTRGDRILDVTLSKVGGKGLFVKEIEQALYDREIDMAVHSMKDLPAELPKGLVNAAVPTRVDARDCLITATGCTFAELPQGAKVGTSSLRRGSQLRRARPDLNIAFIRGNIDSRLRKLETEGFDAIVLAAAGLTRMGWLDKATELLPIELCVPAVGQGALGIECREEDEALRRLLNLYNDAITARTVAAERAFLGALNGGCQVPIGAYATVEPDGELRLLAMVGSPDGAVLLKVQETGDDPQALGLRAAALLAAQGAEAIIADARRMDDEQG